MARRWALGLSLLLLLSLASVAALWSWLGSGHALRFAWAQAVQYLPADQQLEVEGLGGSLRAGAIDIDLLHWRSPQMEVKLRGLHLRWSWQPLLWQRHLALQRLEVAAITLIPGESESDDQAPAALPADIALPLTLALPLDIGRLHWANASAQGAEIGPIRGDYRFDGAAHALTLDTLTLAQGEYRGQYRGQVQLQAQAPLALKADVAGSLSAPIPGRAQPLQAQLQAQLQGVLSPESALQLQASLQGQEGMDIGTNIGTEMRAEVAAQIAPWQAMPVTQLSAQAQALNLALLWPQAPQTDLHGSADVSHQGAQGWQIQTQWRNRSPGPWDSAHLPLSAIEAQAQWDGAALKITRAQLALGQGPRDGHIDIQALRWDSAQRALDGQIRLQSLNPALLHSTWPCMALGGDVQAHHDDATGVRFTVDVESAPVPPQGKTPCPPLPPTRLQAQGQWQGEDLSLANLRIHSLQAQLEARHLRLHLAEPKAQGEVRLQIPGAQLDWQGQITPHSGDNRLSVALQDGAQAQRWMAQWPDMAGLPPLPPALRQPPLRWAGQALLNMRSQGGWQDWVRQWDRWANREVNHRAVASGAAPSAPPRPLALHTEVKMADFTLTPTDSAAGLPWRLQAVQLTLDGNAQQWSAQLQGQARQGGQRYALRMALEGAPSAQALGVLRLTQWQAQWYPQSPPQSQTKLQTKLQTKSQTKSPPDKTAAPWSVQLSAPLSLVLDTTQREGLRLDWGSGQARIQSPLPGDVSLQWQEGQWTRSPTGAMQVRSQGQLHNLPLAWANAIAPAGPDAESTWLESMGLGGDVQLNADWAIDTQPDASPQGQQNSAAHPLQAMLRIYHAGGDLRLLAIDDGSGTTVRSRPGGAAQVDKPRGSAAGLRQASVTVHVQGGEGRAEFSWDSARAGRIQAQGRSPITMPQGDWMQARWPEDAPISAQISAQMPDLGLWARLAPPGWRIKGRLGAELALSGSRQDPQWRGQLQADDVGLRSVIDGVDLQNGQLRATLDGRALHITELRLSAGKGSSARILGPSGNRTQAPADGGLLTGSGTISWAAPAGDASAALGLRMDLNAQAQGLQVQVRADRQISVSGQLQAQLQGGQFTLRGQLRTDRASILLPEASAPRLGADIHIRRHRPSDAPAPSPDAQNASETPEGPRLQPVLVPDVQISLDLGPDFALQGQGITTRLTGQIDIRSSAETGGQPRVIGEVRTEAGRYRAWGQSLDVESGIVRFAGPYDNPQLDILALRPQIAVRAGVQVSGTAQHPRVRLYAEPDLPDAEKLSWVVLGHSSASGGSETALLQQAALALLGPKTGSPAGSIAQGLGLDEVGLKGPKQGQDAQSAALTLGKRLSSDLYVTYEHSLSGTLGTLYLFYDLSRHLTLRGQTGTTNALDLVYTLRYD